MSREIIQVSSVTDSTGTPKIRLTFDGAYHLTLAVDDALDLADEIAEAAQRAIEAGSGEEEQA